ncbi:MAG: hypothetical protein QXV32_07650 [Conexivisphaerales archaeon]
MEIPLAILERVSSEFPDSSIFLTGCSADQKRREYCEFNLAVYPAIGRARLMKYEDDFYVVEPIHDVKTFISYPYEVISDPQWNLPKIMNPESKERVKEARRLRLKEAEVNSTSNLMNSFAFLEKGKIREATLYFVSSIADVSELLLLQRGIEPHPSHLASQLRENSLLSQFAEAASFDLASDTNAKRRAEKISLYLDRARGRATARKMMGLTEEGKIFDSLYYSYWAISRLLSTKRDSQIESVLANSLNLSADELHLKRHLQSLSSSLKDLIKHSV